MTILLKDIWPIENLKDYKVHFARRAYGHEPLEVYAMDKDEWQEWQKTWPGKNEFNRPFIFSLMQFYHETDIWLFGGIFEVLGIDENHPKKKQYKVKLTDLGKKFIGRLKIHSSYRSRTIRVNMENYYQEFEVQEILREPYSGRAFSGYEQIDLSFDELKTIIENGRPDWKAALASSKGVYLITDKKSNKRYVGSAYGEEGIWSRWEQYINSGHGGNKGIKEHLNKQKDPLDYCREHFRFALLEQWLSKTPDEKIIERESFWKEVLGTREHGLNHN